MEILDMDRDKILAMDMDMVWGEAAYMLAMEVAPVNGHIELPREIKEIQERTNEGSRQISALEVALDARIRPAKTGGVTPEGLRNLLSLLYFPAGLMGVAKQYMKDKRYEMKAVKIGGKTVKAYYGCEICDPLQK
jgi:hypothetical protein